MVKKDLLTRCKGIPVFRYSLLSLLFLFFTYYSSSGQVQAVTCNGQINISVGQTCDIGTVQFTAMRGTNDSIAIKVAGTNKYLQSGTTLSGGALILGNAPRAITQIDAPVGKLLLGKVHTYELWFTGNKCWGSILIEDKLAPTITCQPMTTVECADGASYLNANIKSTSILRRPTVTDNCGFKDSSLVIEDKRLNCGGFIARHWTYTDCGNIVGTCSDTIRLTPIDGARKMCPDPLVTVKCNDNITPDGIYDVIFARALPPSALPTARDTFIYKDTTALKAAYPFFKTAGLASFDAAGLIKKKGKLDAVCGFIITSNDVTHYPCGNSCNSKRKIIRTWTILDWCSGVSPVSGCVQIIEAVNTDGPTVKANDITTSVDPWACAANFSFPAPEILHDACDPNPTYTVRGPLGVTIRWDASSSRWMAIGAPKGVNEFIYVGKDCCGHEGYDTINVSVFDKTPPVAVAKQNIIISLTTAGEGDGSAKLFANSVDNGSYDSCTPVYLELRRDEDPSRDNDGCGYTGNKTYNDDGHPDDGSKNPASPNYDPDNGLFVKFCCDDITNREGLVPFGIVKVWMRVWDDGNSSGIIGDTINGHTDNYNETWVNVRVEDKLTPKLVCPSDVTINCDGDASNLSLTGRARAYSNCVDLSVDYRDQDLSNSCGAGTINRTWFIRGNPSIQCVQRIYKNSPTGVFGANNITWPSDATTNCADNFATVKPTWVSGTCDLVGLSLKSDTFYFESGACLKILNHWTVINWCTYNANYSGAPGSAPGIWYRTQVIKVVDNEKPTLGSCEPKTYEVNSSTCDVKDLVITQTADDQGQCSSGLLKWIVFVDLWGDGTTDLEYSSFLPSNDTNLGNDTNGNGFNDRYVAPTSKGSAVSITIPEIIGGASSHKVTWKVVDGCGNVTTCTQNFSVADKKKPSPYCLSISSALMQNGQVELWAVDFNVGSSDNCTSKGNLLYTFDEANPVLTKLNQSHYFKGAGIEATLAEYNAGNAQKWIPATKSSGKVFGCSSLPSVDVKMTVWDEKLNYEFCMVKLSLLDNQGACGPVQTTSVSGKLVSNNGQSIKNAEVVLDNGVPELLKSTVTTASGEYTFNNASMHYDYTIAGKKTDDYLNGVSTLDLVMIQRHILGLEKLDGPYNLVAADANGDEKVTASDLTELRKLILGIYAQLPKTDSWKFIDKTQSFADANNPWPLNEKIKLKDLSQIATNQNFVAVKVGDVNNSAKGNIDNQSTDTRGKTELVTENKAVTANELQSVVFNADIDQVYGLQFTLTLNNADLADVFVSGQKISDSNIAKLTDNKYTVSWNNVKAVNGNEILALNIIPKVKGNISDLISINSNVTSAEVYTGDVLQTNKLSLRFGGKDNVSVFTVYQNEPNPFNDKTIISFNLPVAGNATLKVFDVTGQVIYKNNGSFGKGINSFTLTRDDLPSKGVMIYQIESGANVGTKKMIGLE